MVEARASAAAAGAGRHRSAGPASSAGEAGRRDSLHGVSRSKGPRRDGRRGARELGSRAREAAAACSVLGSGDAVWRPSAVTARGTCSAAIRFSCRSRLRTAGRRGDTAPARRGSGPRPWSGGRSRPPGPAALEEQERRPRSGPVISRPRYASCKAWPRLRSRTQRPLTNRYCSFALPRSQAGSAMKPSSVHRPLAGVDCVEAVARPRRRRTGRCGRAGRPTPATS